jgi:molecular chaperone HtpG
VTLVKTMDGDGFDVACDAVGAALSRWCRHATIPLHWLIERTGSVHRERADRPFAVAAPFAVESELEGARLVVGVATGAAYLFEGDDERPLAGYYNRGLTLAERRGPSGVVAGVRYKVDSPLLEHTLSRDDVRQDEVFHRLVRYVNDVVEGPLRTGLASALAEAATEGDPDRYVALLAAARPAGIRLAPFAVTLPLCDPVEGAGVATAQELRDGRRPVLWSDAPSALTNALAAEGRRVVQATHPDVPTLLEHVVDVSVEPAEEVFLLLDVVTARKLEKRCLEEVARVLDRVGVRFHSVEIAEVSGAAPIRAAYAVSPSAIVHLVHAVSHPRLRGGDAERRLLLSRSHPAVQAASRLARKSPSAAGQLLARYVLVEDRGELSRGLCDDLLELAEEEA